MVIVREVGGYKASLMENREIFKYCPYKNGLEILSSQSLKFTNPMEFNDPFEFDINLLKFDFNDLEPDIKKDYESIKNNYVQQYGQGIETFIESIPKHKLEESYKKSQLDKISRSSVCCFSKEKKNIVLWAHYADQHNGVCLIFDVLSTEPFHNHANYVISQGPVIYESYGNYQPSNYLKDKLVGISKLLFTKSKDWEYENEYRYQMLDNGGFIRFNNAFLKGIIFGLRVSDIDKTNFISAAEQMGYLELNYFHVEKKQLKLEISVY